MTKKERTIKDLRRMIETEQKNIEYGLKVNDLSIVEKATELILLYVNSINAILM